MTRPGRTPPPDWRDVLTAVSALTQEGRGWLSLRLIAGKIGGTPQRAAIPLAVLIGRGDVRRGTGNGQTIYRLTEQGAASAAGVAGAATQATPEQIRDLAATIAGQAQAIAGGTVTGPVYGAVRRLAANAELLAAWQPDDRSNPAKAG